MTRSDRIRATASAVAVLVLAVIAMFLSYAERANWAQHERSTRERAEGKADREAIKARLSKIESMLTTP